MDDPLMISSSGEDYKLVRKAKLSSQTPITSICFHPATSFIFYAQNNRIVLWDWEHEISLEYFASELTTIRYVNFTAENLIITGISSKHDSPHHEIKNFGSFDHILTLLHDIVILFEQLNTHGNLQASQTFQQILCLLKRNFEMIDNISDSGTTEEQSIDNNAKASLEMILKRQLHITKEFASTYGIRSHVKRIQFFDLIRKRYQNRINLRAFDDIISEMETCMAILSCAQDQRSGGSGIIRVLSPAYLLQAWDFDKLELPNLGDSWRNVITWCYIHNDSTVAISRCGRRICSFKREVVSQIDIHSLEKRNLGCLLYTYKCLYNVISLSFSPSFRYLLIGMRDCAYIAEILTLKEGSCVESVVITNNRRSLLLEEDQELDDDGVNCISWAPGAADGIIVGYKRINMRILRCF